MVISAGALVVIMAIATTPPTATVVWVPFILLVQVVATVGIVLLLSITIVYVRDLGQALPLMLQLGLFATPVAYSAATLVARTRGHLVRLRQPARRRDRELSGLRGRRLGPALGPRAPARSAPSRGSSSVRCCSSGPRWASPMCA